MPPPLPDPARSRKAAASRIWLTRRHFHHIVTLRLLPNSFDPMMDCDSKALWFYAAAL